jgi:hypothetical protein
LMEGLVDPQFDSADGCCVVINGILRLRGRQAVVLLVLGSSRGVCRQGVGARSRCHLRRSPQQGRRSVSRQESFLIVAHRCQW